jgi:hypothetical protein
MGGRAIFPDELADLMFGQLPDNPGADEKTDYEGR